MRRRARAHAQSRVQGGGIRKRGRARSVNADGNNGRGNSSVGREARAPDTRLPLSLRAAVGLPAVRKERGNSRRNRIASRNAQKTFGREKVGTRSIQQNSEETDPDKREIRRLERLLGVSKKRKRAEARGKTFQYANALMGGDEELEDLLHFCNGSLNGTREREHDADIDHDEDEGFSTSQSDSDHSLSDPADALEMEEEESSSEELDDAPANHEQESEEQSESESESESGSEEEMDKKKEKMHLAELGIVAVQAAPASSASGRYIPPSQRVRAAVENGHASQSAQVARASRRVRGLLNRLADANACNIAGSVEQWFKTPMPGMSQLHLVTLYATAALDAVRDGSTGYTYSPFVNAHAAVATHLGAKVSIRIPAEVLVGAIRRASDGMNNEGTAGRLVFGYIALIAALYERSAVAPMVIHGIVRMIAQKNGESRAEILRALFKQIGTRLRADDPGSLKDMIAFVIEKFDGVKEQSVKTKVMIDLILAVKNNKLRKDKANAEAQQRTFAWAEKLHTPLKASVDELLDDEFTTARWWENSGGKLEALQKKSDNTKQTESFSKAENTVDVDGEEEGPDLNALASVLRLNTASRRSAFRAIMSATSVSDAYARLQRIDALKNLRDIACVALLCCGAERNYNVYYADLCKRLCKSQGRSARFAVEYAICATLKQIDDGKLSQRKRSNVSSFAADIIAAGAVQFLGIWKSAPQIDLMNEKLKMAYRDICIRAFEAPDAHVLVKGSIANSSVTEVSVFLRREVRHSVNENARARVDEAIRKLERPQTAPE